MTNSHFQQHRGMQLEERLAWLYSLRRFGMKLGLSTPRQLLEALGSPERDLHVLHLAGSNGKGSTAAIADSIIRAARLHTGLYTSPHLVDFAERIRIDGRPIGRRSLVRLLSRVEPAMDSVARRLGRSLTFFEATTAMAFLHFARSKVDVAIIETGLGGRFDATNVVHPRVTVITPIALEHQRQLGRTLSAIAREKAQIIKREVPVISAAQASGPREVLIRRARALGSPLRIMGRDFHVVPGENGTFDYRGVGIALRGLRCGIPGSHQMENAGVALAACEQLLESGFAIPLGAMRRGVARASCPGRLEIVRRDSAGHARIVLDGAHNPAAARTLARELPRLFAYRRLFLICGAMSDKDLSRLVQPLAREVLRSGGRVIATAARFERSADPRRVASAFRESGARPHTSLTVRAALDRALGQASPEDLVLITGSLYVVGEARALLLPEKYRNPVLPGHV